MSIRSQITDPDMVSPKASARIGRSSQDHVEVRTGLQVALKSWNVGEVVKDTGRWSRTIVKNGPGENRNP